MLKINTFGAIMLCDLVAGCKNNFSFDPYHPACYKCAHNRRSFVKDVQTGQEAIVCPLTQRKQDAEDLIRILEKYTDNLYDNKISIPNQIEEDEFVLLLRKEAGI